MINTIIFDFGNIFINLNDTYTLDYIKHFESSKHYKSIIKTNIQFEKGEISIDSFLKSYQSYFPDLSKEEIKSKWNSILGEFPKYRLDFLKDLKENSNYKLILLSNTNELHISWIKDNIAFYKDFKSCFNEFYLSHEIKLRKPDVDVFNFVLNKNNLTAETCLFIDDSKDNIISADYININTWHLNPKTDDVIDLFKIKSALF